MKTKIFALALATALATDASALAALTPAPDGDLEFATSRGAASPSGDGLLYAPVDPVFSWGGSEGVAAEFMTRSETFLHPSLAGDLMERGTAREWLGAGWDAEDSGSGLTFISFTSSQPEIFGSLAEDAARVTEDLPSTPVTLNQAGTIHGITGIPHPFLAGLAALAGLVTIVARRHHFA
jgi:hypothetical protein